MIVSIIMIVLAFAWLMYETDFMRVRLESTGYQRQQLAVRAKRDFGNMPIGKVKNTQEDTGASYQPSQFIPLDMPARRSNLTSAGGPATTGELNIVCQRG